jgi:hypothetical protein
MYSDSKDGSFYAEVINSKKIQSYELLLEYGNIDITAPIQRDDQTIYHVLFCSVLESRDEEYNYMLKLLKQKFGDKIDFHSPFHLERDKFYTPIFFYIMLVGEFYTEREQEIWDVCFPKRPFLLKHKLEVK